MDWTAVEAEQLNRERAIRGPAGDLVLLRFEGRDADPVYSVLKTYPESGGANGWGSSSAKKQDGGFYTQCQVADVDGEALSVLTGKGRATHFAIGTELRGLGRADRATSAATSSLEVWWLRSRRELRALIASVEIVGLDETVAALGAFAEGAGDLRRPAPRLAEAWDRHEIG